MHVLYLINYAGKAGTEKYVENLVNYLHPDRAECSLCYNIDGPLADKMRERGVPCHQLEMKNPFDRRAAKKLAQICRENNVDVIHAQYPRENYIALLSLKYYDKPRVVFTSHLTIYQNAVWKFFNRRMTPRDHCVISVCGQGKDILISNGVPADKIRVVYNGIDAGEAPPKREIPRERPATGGDPDAFTALALARLSPEKGLKFLVDAIDVATKESKCKLRLYIAGDGDQRAELEDYIAQKGLGETVKLLGFRCDVDALLRDADVYVNSSSANEAMSFAMLEALAAGLPLVATDVGGSADLVHEGGDSGFVVKYGDVSGFATAIAGLARDRALYAEYAESARRKAENEFELTRLLDEVYNCYL